MSRGEAYSVDLNGVFRIFEVARVGATVAARQAARRARPRIYSPASVAALIADDTQRTHFVYGGVRHCGLLAERRPDSKLANLAKLVSIQRSFDRKGLGVSPGVRAGIRGRVSEAWVGRRRMDAALFILDGRMLGGSISNIARASGDGRTARRMM